MGRGSRNRPERGSEGGGTRKAELTSDLLHRNTVGEQLQRDADACPRFPASEAETGVANKLAREGAFRHRRNLRPLATGEVAAFSNQRAAEVEGGSQFIGEALGAAYAQSPQKEIGKFPVTLTAAGKNSPPLCPFSSNAGSRALA